MQVNLGGDRIGSGAKMQQELHNYGRATFNLSKRFQSSLSPGLLYPCYVNIALPGDNFEMNIDAFTRTIPTRGPLFGAFKMQVDVYIAPIRLYHGVLHNNPTRIGLKMKDVKLPTINLYKTDSQPINKTNIWKYLGLSGLGLMESAEGVRKINAVPLLAYYDIFKNYYANKQEDDFYYVSGKQNPAGSNVDSVAMCSLANNSCQAVNYPFTYTTDKYILLSGTNLYSNGIANFTITDSNGNDITNYATINASSNTAVQLVFNRSYTIKSITGKVETMSEIQLSKEKLSSLDDVREKLLGIKIGQDFDVASLHNICKPLGLNTSESSEEGLNQPLIGLVTKTYQSDLYNNWLKTETIEGENGIGEITRIDTSNGLELDALNLAQKVYNMLNRIAISGGTYQDYIEAVYTHKTYQFNETPIYVGGMSAEIKFEEIIATTQSETTDGGFDALGAMGGRGIQTDKKDGNIEFDITEPSFVIALVSLTPRITYSQGNKFYLTDIFSIDDLHKPALDGIGFQDLLVEQMCYTGTSINGDQITERLSAGKTLAWANYMTDVDECFGDFADKESYAYMTLNRNYTNTDEDGNYIAPIDITTYIDPGKYNYAFAYQQRDSQNFWTEIRFDIKARRIMSAKQIPNL